MLYSLASPAGPIGDRDLVIAHCDRPAQDYRLDPLHRSVPSAGEWTRLALAARPGAAALLREPETPSLVESILQLPRRQKRLPTRRGANGLFSFCR